MARSIVTSALMVVGSLLVLVAVALPARAYLDQWAHDLSMPQVADEFLPARLEPDPIQPAPFAAPSDSPTPSPAPEQDAGTSGPDPAVAPSAVDVAVAAPPAASLPPFTLYAGRPEVDPPEPPDFGQPIRVVIPSIDLNASVAEVGIESDVYEVLWWDVGWHQDSASLGAPGNTLLNGHLDTIDAGRVFARLRELRPGDLIYAYSAEYRTAWVVESSERVPESDHSFVVPTEDVRMTLYTCEGVFDWGTRRYSHYRVVVARLAEATKRSPAE